MKFRFPLKNRLCALLAGAILFWVPVIGMAETGGQQALVFQEISAAQLIALAKSAGIEASIRKNTAQKVELLLNYGSFKAILNGFDCVAGQCASLKITAYFTKGKTSLEKLNEWNKNTFFCKAFLGQNDLIHLMAFSGIKNGVTEKRLKSYLLTFKSLGNLFVKFVSAPE